MTPLDSVTRGGPTLSPSDATVKAGSKAKGGLPIGNFVAVPMSFLQFSLGSACMFFLCESSDGIIHVLCIVAVRRVFGNCFTGRLSY